MTARDVRILDLDVALARAPEHHSTLAHVHRAAVPGEHRDLPLEAELGRRRGLGRLRRRFRLVDHRRARLDLLLRLAVGTLGPPRLDHARRDPELAYGQVVVGLEQYAGRRQQRVVLALGVLADVLLELRLQGGLVPLELLAVGGREVDRVFVRHVDARHGDRLVVVHLLRELARELHRLHVRPEGTPEDALEERLDLLLDCPEDHGCGRTLPPGASMELAH